jgi:hypothetical protein
MMVVEFILSALSEMFSMTPITTGGYVEEDSLHDLHSRQI